MMRIEDSVAVVTGGQRGIGRAIVDHLITAGARTVYATARHPTNSVDPRVIPVPLDVTDPESIARLVGVAREAQIVINNAGISVGGSLLSATDHDLREVLDTNLYGPIRVAQAFAPILAANGGGALVNMHSVLSWLAGSGAYGVSKAALWSATNSLRTELRPMNTLVVGVHVGYVDTDMTRNIKAPKSSPDSVAEAILRALREDQPEVLVDDISQYVKSQLAGPVESLTIP
ncbi:SDR family oxidoreductase [Nocardia salmonicida]|uniref:SDR family oxidoreductase n=1 Tax=Nocardia salmonicida TaxID=53431 RepID=UPI003642A326